MSGTVFRPTAIACGAEPNSTSVHRSSESLRVSTKHWLASNTQRVEDTLQAWASYEGGESRARFAFKPPPAIAEDNLSRQIAR